MLGLSLGMVVVDHSYLVEHWLPEIYPFFILMIILSVSCLYYFTLQIEKLDFIGKRKNQN